MQYAIVDDQRLEAFPHGRGICQLCLSPLIAKCGSRVIHHWAHISNRNCDPWWENETLWHREWKNKFPENCREIIHSASDGEIHRADIKTQTGIIIEIQHSYLSDIERMSRESFYKNLVWIVDGSTFYQNFEICHLLPDPASEVACDLIWTRNSNKHGVFFRRSEGCFSGKPGDLYPVHSIREIENEVNASYRGHHQYKWVRPRHTWLNAICPVYIDFGNDFLAKLEIYDEFGLPCIRLISKKKFIHDVMTEVSALDIATRFYQIE